jgi:hypothetical protein
MKAQNYLTSCRARVEPLEQRTLMSVAWNTADTVDYPLDADSSFVAEMAADKSGNVYSVRIDTLSTGGSRSTLREQTGGQWTDVLSQDGAIFDGIATDAAGNLFIAGHTIDASGKDHWQIWEKPAAGTTLSAIENFNGNAATGIATDSAGDVFATGVQTVTTTVNGKTTTTNYGIIRKLTPSNGSFVASTVYQNAGIGLAVGPQSISAVASGASAGIYAVGNGWVNSPRGGAIEYWDVVKSTDAGGHWAVVEQFRYDPNLYYSEPRAIVGDGLGNVYVAGSAQTLVISGYSHNKPVYEYDWSWVVRKSSSGNSGTWSTTGAFRPAATFDAYAVAMGADPAGHIYVVGATDYDAFIRTNAGGSWSTSDEYSGADSGYAEYTAFTADSNGNLYAGGDDDFGTFVRSATAPGAMSSLFGSASIANGPKSRLSSGSLVLSNVDVLL